MTRDGGPSQKLSPAVGGVGFDKMTPLSLGCDVCISSAGADSRVCFEMGCWVDGRPSGSPKKWFDIHRIGSGNPERSTRV